MTAAPRWAAIRCWAALEWLAASAVRQAPDQNSFQNTPILAYSAKFASVLTSIRRAGADVILTYFAKDAARLL